MPDTNICLDGSLATTPGNTVASATSMSTDWDPDTPTLKAWARQQYLKSTNALSVRNDMDYFDHMTGRSAGTGTTSLSSSDQDAEGGDDADDENTDDCDDFGIDDAVDNSCPYMDRLSIQNSGNGVLYRDNGTDDNYEDDDMDEVEDNRVDRYFHVADDSEDEDNDDVEDNVYDDSS